MRFGLDLTIFGELADPALLVEDSVTLPVQINGKVKSKISVPPDATKDSLIEAALAEGDGSLSVLDDKGSEAVFSIHGICPACSTGVQGLDPRLFSFNSRSGACPSCQGMGTLPRIREPFILGRGGTAGGGRTTGFSDSVDLSLTSAIRANRTVAMRVQYSGPVADAGELRRAARTPVPLVG